MEAPEKVNIKGKSMTGDEEIKQAKKCPYYGCAGERICTYYSWTTHCYYPVCDKEDLGNNGSVYEHLNNKEE